MITNNGRVKIEKRASNIFILLSLVVRNFQQMAVHRRFMEFQNVHTLLKFSEILVSIYTAKYFWEVL